LGNINDSSFDEIYHTSKFVDFIKSSFKVNEKCKNCQFFYLCRGGGCKRSRQDYDYCLAYKEFFASSEYKMKQIKVQN
jgi:uncharacterized protein